METIRIVSKNYPLSNTYIPENLILDTVYNIWLCKHVYDCFYKLTKQMKRDGVPSVALVSGYRSYSYQQKIFSKKVQSMISEGMNEVMATQRASMIVAMPGCSEHQLGNSIDVTTKELAMLEDPLITDFEQTKEGQWLLRYAKDFGFILRYPKDKTARTGVVYEPWHYRYVGTHHAKTMVALGICLEEYLEDLNIF